MLRNKVKGICIAAVTITAISSLMPVFSEGNISGGAVSGTLMGTVKADSDYIVTEFEDSAFRKALINYLENMGRANTPEIEVPAGYESPIFSTDLPMLAELESFNYDGEELADSEKIKSVKGIEYLKGLKNLTLPGNLIEDIDLSKNKALINVSLIYNKLKRLNISENKSLEALYASGNMISSIDLSKNESLKMLYLDGNGLKELDLSGNTALNTLGVSNNKLEKLDLTKNLRLIKLDVQRNCLRQLDLTENGAINGDELYITPQEIKIYKDDITEFDLKSFVGPIENKRFLWVVETPDVSYDYSTGIVTLKNGEDRFSYQLSTGRPNADYKESMFVNVSLYKNQKPSDEPAQDAKIDQAYMEGYSDGTMKPDGLLTRAEAAALYNRLLPESADVSYERSAKGCAGIINKRGGICRSFLMPKSSSLFLVYP